MNSVWELMHVALVMSSRLLNAQQLLNTVSLYIYIDQEMYTALDVSL